MHLSLAFLHFALFLSEASETLSPQSFHHIPTTSPLHSLYDITVTDRVHGLGRGQNLREYQAILLVKYMRKFSSISG